LAKIKLEEHKCYFCGKKTIVPRISPCDNPEKLTGMWLIRMDDDFNEKTIGVVCKECAFSREDLTLGFCGGEITNLDLWEASLGSMR